MDWLEGRGLAAFKDADQETRDRIARILFEGWWTPLIHLGVIHGDPHLGNYSFTGEADRLNLLDFGCVRVFPPRFVGGVVKLHRAIVAGDRAAERAAYEAWGFQGLSDDLMDVLGIWARFIYGPLLDDRVRTVADGVAPGDYGRREAFQVKKALEEKGPITIPREFVFMDRAAIGLGSAFLHLGAEQNWRRLFEPSLEGFSEERLAERQAAALKAVGLVRPATARRLALSLALTAGVSAEPVRLNQIQVIGTHNSYHAGLTPQMTALLKARKPEVVDELDYSHPSLTTQLDHGVRQLELDVFADTKGGRFAHPFGANLTPGGAKAFDPGGRDGQAGLQGHARAGHRLSQRLPAVHRLPGRDPQLVARPSRGTRRSSSWWRPRPISRSQARRWWRRSPSRRRCSTPSTRRSVRCSGPRR